MMGGFFFSAPGSYQSVYSAVSAVLVDSSVQSLDLTLVSKPGDRFHFGFYGLAIDNDGLNVDLKIYGTSYLSFASAPLTSGYGFTVDIYLQMLNSETFTGVIILNRDGTSPIVNSIGVTTTGFYMNEFPVILTYKADASAGLAYICPVVDKITS